MTGNWLDKANILEKQKGDDEIYTPDDWVRVRTVDWGVNENPELFKEMLMCEYTPPSQYYVLQHTHTGLVYCGEGNKDAWLTHCMVRVYDSREEAYRDIERGCYKARVVEVRKDILHYVANIREEGE